MDRLRKKTTAHIRFNIASMVAFFLLTSSLSISAGYIPSLVEQLKDKDKAKDVSDRLGLIGEPAIPYLINVIKDGGKYQKRYAVRSLRNMGPKAESAIPILVTLIKDSDSQTREYLVETLSVMTQKPETVLPSLKYISENDPEKNIKNKAKEAIATIKGSAIKNTSEPNSTEQIVQYGLGLYKIPFNASLDELLNWATINKMKILNKTEKQLRDEIENLSSNIQRLKDAYESDKQYLFEMEKVLLEIQEDSKVFNMLEDMTVTRLKESLNCLKTNPSFNYANEKYHLTKIFDQFKLSNDGKTIIIKDDEITGTAYKLILSPTTESETKFTGLEELEVCVNKRPSGDLAVYATSGLFEEKQYENIRTAIIDKYGFPVSVESSFGADESNAYKAVRQKNYHIIGIDFDDNFNYLVWDKNNLAIILIDKKDEKDGFMVIYCDQITVNTLIKVRIKQWDQKFEKLRQEKTQQDKEIRDNF